MVMPTGPAELDLCHSPVFGDYLVDGKGMTLYAFAKDKQNSNQSACTDATCTAMWMPFLTLGTPVMGMYANSTSGVNGIQSNLLGSFSRPDGSTQVTYNGWPLYYFSGDLAAGDMNGMKWFIVPADGFQSNK